MKTSQTALLLMALLSATLHGVAADSIRSDVTIQGTVVMLSKAEALQFTNGHHLDADAAAGLKDLQLLVEQNKAEAVAGPAITTKNGQRARIESGTTKLEVEPVQSPSGDQIDLNLLLNYGSSVKINTACMVKNGDVKFLGAFDAAEGGKNSTCLVFVRASAPR